MLVQLVCAVLVILFTFWYIKRRKFYIQLAKYKGPQFGLTSIIRQSNLTPVDFMQNMIEWNKIYGSRMLLKSWFFDQLIVSDNKLVDLLVKSTTILKKSSSYHFIKPWLGNGLLTSEGLEWKKQRKLLTPAFHFEILERFLEVFDNHAKTLINKFRKHVDGSSFDIYNYVTLCALDIICETSMGTSVQAQEFPNSDYIKSIKGMLLVFGKRYFSTFKALDFLFRLTQDYQLQKECLGVLHSYTESVIVQRRNELTAKNCYTVNENRKNKKIPLLDLLLQSRYDGEPLTNKQIREQVDTFMFEGHDTISSALSFILYCIAKYPEVQDKIISELRSIFVNEKLRPCTLQDLQRMEYMYMVIKESMRLYPPALIFGRHLEEDFYFDDEVLPKGLSITVFIYGLHRQKDIFPSPEKFDPERFSPANVEGRSPYAYIPFSAGVRNCIGQRFALLEIKTVVCEVLRNFELSVEPGEEPMLMFEILLRSANGVKIKIRERKF